MILDLTKENLQKNGFSEIEAENILKQKNESIFYQENSCIISSAENKIYTEIDFYRKEYLNKSNPQFPYNCPDLVNEYFDLALTAFLRKQKTVLGILFNKTDQTNNFISNEIEKTKERIKEQKEFLEKMKLFTFESKKNDILICEAYINFLKTKIVEPKQQNEDVNPDENKKTHQHTHIFKGNSFEVWQSMFDEFGINESSRTDVKFMFEEMKKQGEGLIHNTVNQTTFLDWIRETYNGLIVEKTSNYSRTKTRLQAYLRAKELYNK